MKKDIRLENYILKSADFAIPILLHLEQLVEIACPEVEVKLKWGMPHFEYKNKNLCHMASFKAHCAFGFWNVKVMNDPDKILDKENAMGSFGRITSMKDLPSDEILIKYILEAKRTIDEGIKLPQKSKIEKEKAILMHPDFWKLYSNIILLLISLRSSVIRIKKNIQNG